MVHRELDSWAEEMSSMVRCALSKLREIAGDHLKYERALSQALPPCLSVGLLHIYLDTPGYIYI